MIITTDIEKEQLLNDLRSINDKVVVNTIALNNIEDNDQKKKDSQMKTDEKLVKIFIENPTHENFNKLWERYYFGIKGYAFKFVQDWDKASDIACETFERAWEYKETYDFNKAKFSTWIYKICKNLCLCEISRLKKLNVVNQDVSNIYDSAILHTGTTVSNSTQYIVDNGNLVAHNYQELTQRMYDVSLNEIENLGGIYTKILKMKLIEDLKIREIADILNLNESTVKNYLYKGKDIITKKLQKKHHELYGMFQESVNEEVSKNFY